MPELHVIHNLSESGHFGGTELVLDALLELGGDRYVLVPERGVPGGFLLLDQHKQRLDRHFGRPIPVDQVFDPGLGQFFHRILAERRIDRVLFHHLLDLPIHLLALPAVYGVQSAVIWHDYFLICPSFNLLNDAGRYCEIDQLPKTECVPCSARLFGWPAQAMPARRRLVRELLGQVDLNVFSSPESRRIARSLYAIPDARTLVCPVPARLSIDQGQAPATAMHDRNKVLVLGNFSRNKGSRLLRDLAGPLMAAGFKLRIAGRLDADETAKFDSSVEVIGRYSRHDLAEVAADCGIALFLSVWPETYSMTLSEVRQLGLTPVAPDLGAFRDRIADGKDGWLFDRTQPAAMLAAIEAARQAGPIVCDERYLSAADYAERIAKALPGPLPDAARLRDAAWRPDVPVDLASFSLVRPLYYLPGEAPGANGQSLLRLALGYYRRHGLLAAMRRTAKFLREPRRVQ